MGVSANAQWRNFGKYFNFLHCRLEVPRHNSNIASSLRNTPLTKLLCQWKACILTWYLGFTYFHSPGGVCSLTMWIPENIGGGGSQKSSAGCWKIRDYCILGPSLTFISEHPVCNCGTCIDISKYVCHNFPWLISVYQAVTREDIIRRGLLKLANYIVPCSSSAFTCLL